MTPGTHALHALCLLITVLFCSPSHAYLFQLPDASGQGGKLPPEYAQAYDKAVSALQGGQLDEAAASFKEAAALAPASPFPLLGLAEVALKRQDMIAVKAQLDKALAAAPQSFQVYLALGRYYFTIKNPGKAETSLREAIRLSPDTLAPKLELATLLAGSKDQSAEAESLFRESLKLNPNHGGACFGLGSLLASQGETDEALQMFGHAMRLSPDDSRPCLAIAAVHANNRNLDEALSYYDQALERDAKSLDALYGKAQVNVAQGKKDEALAQCEKLLSLDPRHTGGLFVSGMLYLDKGDLEKAKSSFTATLEIVPDNPWVLNNLAWTMLATNSDLSRAARLASKAVEIQPENPQFLDTYARILARSGDKAGAIVRLERAVRFAPKSAELWFSLAEVSEAAQERGKALKAYEKVVAVGAPDDAMTRQAIVRMEKLKN